MSRPQVRDEDFMRHVERVILDVDLMEIYRATTLLVDRASGNVVHEKQLHCLRSDANDLRAHLVTDAQSC